MAPPYRPPSERPLRASDIAALLVVNRRHVGRLVNQGRLPAQRPGERDNIFPLDLLRAWAREELDRRREAPDSTSLLKDMISEETEPPPS